MAKIKEVKQETINTPINVLTIDTENYQDEFLYGKSIEKLKRNQIEWILWGKYFMGSTTYTTVWVKTVTGVWFKPSLVKINAAINGAISNGTYYNGSVNCQYYFTGGWVWDASGIIGYSAYLEVSANASIMTTITPTSDGFTINVTNILGGAIAFIYECYG